MQGELLAIRGLDVALRTRAGDVAIVADVELDVARGEVVALVGESGSGKTTVALSIARLLGDARRVVRGEVRFEDRDLVRASEAELQSVRGARIGYLFQDPLSAFDPVLTLGEQIGEGLRWHRRLSRDQALARARGLLATVELPEPERVLAAYPHELSGGMRQRAALAMALACEPALLVADEPISALDATHAASILALVRKLARERQLGVLLVTHDFGVVASTADRVAVMYAGRIVERASVRELLEAPAHPYTRALLASLPARAARGQRLTPIAGQAPAPGAWPAGCAFHPRCALAREACSRERPPLAELGPGRAVACPFHAEGARP